MPIKRFCIVTGKEDKEEEAGKNEEKEEKEEQEEEEEVCYCHACLCHRLLDPVVEIILGGLRGMFVVVMLYKSLRA